MNQPRLGLTLLAVATMTSATAVIPLSAKAQSVTRDKEQQSEAQSLNTLVVTGERVERSLQQTASSVAVFDENLLEQQAGADRIEQLLDQVPNLQRGAGDVGVAIRGQDTTGVLIGANSFLGGSRPRATLQIDGRSLNYNEFIYGLSPLWDVERVEVFRGPQTTSQGRNAIAGAIFIETKDPTFEFEGAARALAGNYGTRQTSVVLSGPLVEEQLAGRIALDWRKHNSWMNYTAPDVFVGADREDDDYANARAKFLFTPEALPELEMLLTYSHLSASNPQGETADEPFSDRIQSIQNGAHWDTDVDALVLDTDYQLNDDWQLSFTSSYADSRSERFASPGFGTSEVSADEYSLEGLVHFEPLDGPVRGLLGVSYFNADQDESSDLSAFLGLGNFRDRQTSVGVFGELTFDLTPRLHLTGGGRWQRDTQDRQGTLGPVALDYDKTFSAFLPKLELSYDWRENVLVGISAKKGYNPGGTTVSFTTGQVDEFDEESLWSYELFTRATLAGGDLQLSGNLYYTDFTDAQRPLINLVTLPNGLTAESTEFANAPSAESYGLEAQALWRARPDLQLRAAFGLSRTEITETLLANDPLLGKEFQRAPRVTAALGANFQPTEKLNLDISTRYNSSYFSDDVNNPDYKIDGVAIVDAKASYDFNGLTAFTYVRNATDKNYRLWQFRPGNASLGDPREFGIGLETRF